MTANHISKLVGMAIAVAPLAPAPENALAQSLPRVIMQTELGEIEVEVDSVHAPITARNFLRYVDEGHYNPGLFYRTVTLDNQPNNDVLIEVIQGGVDPEQGLAAFDPIPLERTTVTGLRHRDGTISVARDGPDTGTSEIFICVGDQPELDFGGKRNPDGQGFAAFGQVVRGMDVVRRIQMWSANGQRLTPPIKILNVSRK